MTSQETSTGTAGTGPAGRPARPVSRVTAVLIALACVVVSGIGVKVTDNIDNDVVRTVGVNQPAHLDGAIVTVTGVRAGTAVSTGSWDDDVYRTRGMILAVTLRVEAPGQKYDVGGLGDDGLTLHTSDRTYIAFGQNTSITAEAGYVATGDVLFEVDPQHIDGAYVEVYHSEIVYSTEQKLHIRLGITKQNAARWAASAKGRTISSQYADGKPLR